MKNNPLPSLKQQALLTYIDGFIAENKYAPSYREVMRALDYKSVSTVAKHIDGLIERGWLVKRDNSARSVEVIYKAGQTPEKNSPTPSLSIDHETWLKDLIEKRLAETEEADRAKRAGDAKEMLGWLGLEYTSVELIQKSNQAD